MKDTVRKTTTGLLALGTIASTVPATAINAAAVSQDDLNKAQAAVNSAADAVTAAQKELSEIQTYYSSLQAELNSAHA